MKLINHLLVLSIAAFSLVGCADTDTTSTSSLALSEAEAEALQECVAAIEACRATADSPEEYRELCGELHGCLPERDTASASATDWRAYCAGAEDRCADGALDDATCEELRERCEAARAGATGDRVTDGDEAAKMDPAQCMDDCLGGAWGEALDESLCSERCGIL